MKYSEAKKEIKKRFNTLLKRHGFKQKKHGYIKEYKDFSLGFGYAVYDYLVYPTTFSLKLSSKSFDRLSSHILGTYYEDIILVNLSQLKLFENGQFSCKEYEIEGDEDISKMVEEIDRFLLTTGLPEMEKKMDFVQLEKEKNKSPLGLSRNGLLLAKLVGREDIEEIIKVCNTKMEKIVVIDIIDKYTKVVDFVRTNNTTTLLEIAGLAEDLTPKN